MQIEKNRVVTFEYTLTDNDGEVIDSSEGGEPLSYVHGVGGLIQGVEEALEGKASGDQLNITVPPEKAYGDRDDELVDVVGRDAFGDVEDLDIGMRFRAQTDDGEHMVVVTQIEGDQVTLDGNHPLAGMQLNFDIKVKDVREASAEELEHGHVHGDGCCGGHGEHEGHEHGEHCDHGNHEGCGN